MVYVCTRFMIGICFVLLLSNPNLVQAKFQHVYPGLAQDGLEACISDPSSNLTFNTITRRENCRRGFACIMDKIDNSHQANLAAGSSALGFIPTALTLLGNRRSEIVAIHWHYPILALLLTVAGVSTAGNRVDWISKRDGSGVCKEYCDQCGSPAPSRQNTINRVPKFSRRTRFGFIAFHVVAGIAAAGILWQTYDLSRRAVLPWSCWSAFYPLIWPALEITQYLLDIGVSRLAMVQHDLANALKAFSDGFGMLIFLYATIIYSSLTMVSGANAIKVVAFYGITACTMRIFTAWALDVVSHHSEFSSSLQAGKVKPYLNIVKSATKSLEPPSLPTVKPATTSANRLTTLSPLAPAHATTLNKDLTTPSATS